jgi:peptidoglycan/LPS O-acetylase OafA/YrhL
MGLAVLISPTLREVAVANVPSATVRSEERVPVLDGIRGVAVLLVMVFHFWGTAASGNLYFWERIYSSFAGMGWIGVDLFFVLSGFLITGILFDSRTAPHYFRVFYGRRIVRIFPVYYAALLFFFVIVPLVLPHLHHPAGFDIATSTKGKLLAWTYMLNWYEGLKGFNVIPRPLQHFWSLAIEEQFYLVWPFLVLKLARRRLIAVCVGLMMFSLALRAVLYGIHLPAAPYAWTFCRADSLAAGAIVALAARDNNDWKILSTWARRLAWPAFFAVILVRIASPKCTEGPGISPVFLMGTVELSLAAILFSSCLAIAINVGRNHIMHRVLSTSLLRFFGKYSYCLYVCHLPLIAVLAKAGVDSDHLLKRLHSEFLAVLAVNVIGFAASIAVAFASWHFFEKQWLKLKNLPLLRRGHVSSRGGPLQARTRLRRALPVTRQDSFAESRD